MYCLTPVQQKTLLSRFPSLTLSYETSIHKKDIKPEFTKDLFVVAIPTGTKYYGWITYYKAKDVCYWLELNKENKVVRVSMETLSSTYSRNKWAFGTILYGVLIQDEFIIEDIYMYQGVNIQNTPWNKKFGYIKNLLSAKLINAFLPICKDASDYQSLIICPYTIHHLQFRKILEHSSYMNMSIVNKINIEPITHIVQQQPTERPPRFDYYKPQFKRPSTFMVYADIQYDIYHLLAYDKERRTTTYCDIAYIPNLTVSVMMNKIFRRIRENDNLNYIIESDDEEDFENIEIDKYVDLKKRILMECIFQPKFKRWIPTRVVSSSTKITPIQWLKYGT